MKTSGLAVHSGNTRLSYQALAVHNGVLSIFPGATS